MVTTLRHCFTFSLKTNVTSVHFLGLSSVQSVLLFFTTKTVKVILSININWDFLFKGVKIMNK